MAPYIHYIVLDDLKLNIEIFRGSVYLEDLLRLKNQQANDGVYNPNYNNITDLRCAEMNLSIKDVKEFADQYANLTSLLGDRKCAMLTSSPKAAALSMLYRNYSNNLPMHYEVFTTIEACMRWTNIEAHLIKKIEELLQCNNSNLERIAS